MQTQVTLPEAEPERVDEKRRALTLVKIAKTTVVRTVEDSAVAAKRDADLGIVSDSIEAKYREMKDPVVTAGKAIDSFFRPVLDEIKAARKQLQLAVVEWRERERQEAERRDREAREKAERERIEAENKRLAAERAAQDAAKLAAESASNANATIEDDIAAEQIRMEAEENARLAKQKADEAAKAAEQAATSKTVLAPAVSKATISDGAGSSMRIPKRWTYEVKSIADVPAEFLVVDHGKIREAIRSGVRSIPGLDIYQTERPA